MWRAFLLADADIKRSMSDGQQVGRSLAVCSAIKNDKNVSSDASKA